MEKLEKQIEQTKEIINNGEFQNKYVGDDTIILLENQLIILETLKKILEK